MGLKKARGVKSDVGVRLGNVRRMAGFIFRRLGPMWFWWDLSDGGMACGGWFGDLGGGDGIAVHYF